MSGELYVGNIGTPIILRDSGGSYALSFSGIANAQARVSDVVDFGAYPRTFKYRWHCTTQWVATPTANRSLDIYMAPWDDETGPALGFGSPGTTDAAMTTAAQIAKRFNMFHIGSVRVETAAVGPFESGGLFECPWRYASFFAYNDGGSSLAAVGTYPSVLRITPYYDQIQP